MVRWERRREFQAPGLALLGVALVFLPSSSSYIVAPPAMLRKSVGVSPVAPSALRFSGRLHEASGRQARMGGWRRETWGTLNLQAGYEGVEAELSGDNDDDTNPFGIEDDEGPRFDENDLMRLKVRPVHEKDQPLGPTLPQAGVRPPAPTHPRPCCRSAASVRHELTPPPRRSRSRI